MSKISRKELQEMLSIQSDVDMAASMACAVFRMFGWEYHDGIPGHARLEESIASLAVDALHDDTAASGRMMVMKESDTELGVFVQVGTIRQEVQNG